MVRGVARHYPGEAPSPSQFPADGIKLYSYGEVNGSLQVRTVNRSIRQIWYKKTRIWYFRLEISGWRWNNCPSKKGGNRIVEVDPSLSPRKNVHILFGRGWDSTINTSDTNLLLITPFLSNIKFKICTFFLLKIQVSIPSLILVLCGVRFHKNFLI